jgi:hypothetical protein
LEHIDNPHLYFSLQLQAIADFNVPKCEEAKGSQACMPKVHDNVAIDHQRGDSGSSSMGFPLFCEMKKTLQREQRFKGIFNLGF